MKNSSFKEIYELIKTAKNILILTHKKPDGDALGSQLALKLIIEKLNIPVDVLVTDIPDFIKILPESNMLLMETNKKYDLTILVDASSKERLGDLEYLYDESKNILIFDHHEIESEKEIIHYIDPSMASTTMILYYFAKENNIEIDYSLATLLYLGLLTDTGGFFYPSTTSDVFSIASDLLKTGVNHNKMYMDFMKKEYPLNFILLEKNVIENLEIIENKMAFSYLSNETIKKYPYAVPKELVNVGRYINGIEVSIIMIEEEPGLYKISLRSNNYLNVSEVAKKFNGGGHKLASGITIEGDFNTIKNDIINLTLEQFDQDKI